MIRRPPRSTRTDTLLPYTTLFRSSDRATLGSFHSLMEREGSVERLAIFDVMSGASDSRTDPRKPDIEVLLRRGPRLRRRELPRLSKRKAIGLVERDTPIGDKIGSASCRERVCQYV